MKYPTNLEDKIKAWGIELGFQQVGITDTKLGKADASLRKWLQQGMHGEMDYMQRYPERSQPELLIPGTKSIIMARMNYLPPEPDFNEVYDDKSKAFVSRYAQNKDYHKLIRKRLKQLAEKIKAAVGEFNYRPFTDSAPVMEKPLAKKAGLGWIGKHTNLINPKAGSWFFLGCLYVDLPLKPDVGLDKTHCGSCTKCLDICPTKAIVAPYQVDARRCISYLTIELKGPIPLEFRKAMGNRIYGCDDCQYFCPWNKFAKPTGEPGFKATRGLKTPELLELFNWTEAEFSKNTEGSAIRRIGHAKWLSNIAIALGNAPKSEKIIKALEAQQNHVSEMLREHIEWALQEQQKLNF